MSFKTFSRYPSPAGFGHKRGYNKFLGLVMWYRVSFFSHIRQGLQGLQIFKDLDEQWKKLSISNQAFPKLPPQLTVKFTAFQESFLSSLFLQSMILSTVQVLYLLLRFLTSIFPSSTFLFYFLISISVSIKIMNFLDLSSSHPHGFPYLNLGWYITLIASFSITFLCVWISTSKSHFLCS